MDPSSIILTASGAVTAFYIVGGVLCAVALIFAFAGMKKEEGFPTDSQLKVILGIAAVVMIGAATTAVLASRAEQKERRIEVAEFYEEEAAHGGEEGEEEEAAGGEAPAPEEDSAAGDEPAEGTTTTPEGDEPEAAANGAEVFASNGCGGCHILAAAGSNGATGPSLDGVLPGQSEEMILNSIINPDEELSEGYSAGIMPTSYAGTISEPDLDALVKYLSENAGS